MKSWAVLLDEPLLRIRADPLEPVPVPIKEILALLLVLRAALELKVKTLEIVPVPVKV